MRQTPLEHSARMVTSNYDYQLPPEAMDELLLRPKRPRILAPPPEPPPHTTQPPKQHPWAAAVLGLLVVIVALIAIANWLGKTSETGHQPKPATLPPEPAPASSGLERESVPRAILIQLPPPRATLVKLPEWKIDQSRLLLMPYGEKVAGTLRGFLGSETQLPKVGHTGDTWLVGTTPWIFITVPGASTPAWVDP